MLVGLGNFFFRYRNLLVPLAFALVLLPGPRIFDDPYLPLIAGAGIALLGQIVRAMTIGLKYIVRGGRNRRVYAEDLVTDGIYSHTRNPMYVGNLLILAGLAVASNSWIVVLVAIPLRWPASGSSSCGARSTRSTKKSSGRWSGAAHW